MILYWGMEFGGVTFRLTGVRASAVSCSQVGWFNFRKKTEDGSRTALKYCISRSLNSAPRLWIHKSPHQHHLLKLWQQWQYEGNGRTSLFRICFL